VKELGQPGEARRGWRGGSPAEIERLSNVISAAEREYEALEAQIEELKEEIGDIDDQDGDSDGEARAETRDRLDIRLSRLYRDRDRVRYCFLQATRCFYLLPLRRRYR
jgi:hypothetical protein